MAAQWLQARGPGLRTLKRLRLMWKLNEPSQIYCAFVKSQNSKITRVSSLGQISNYYHLLPQHTQWRVNRALITAPHHHHAHPCAKLGFQGLLSSMTEVPWRIKVLDLEVGVGKGNLISLSLGACTLQRANSGFKATGPSPSVGKM